jgi:hypothetical protein
MIFATVDQIVRRSLLEKSMSIHWYAEYLVHTSAAIRELSFDTLQIIKSANIALNSYNAIDLPDDFVDDLAVCIPVGNLLHPVPKNDSITPLRVHDTTTGAFAPYTNFDNEGDGETFFGFPIAWSWFWNVSDWGEPTGRFFGSTGGGKQNGYKLLKERRQIQLTETFTSDSIVLLYISDGQSADNAAQVDTMAIKCIQAYIDWKSSPNAAMKDSYEAATFYNEKRLLRARLNSLTKTDILQTLRNGFTATIKN